MSDSSGESESSHNSEETPFEEETRQQIAEEPSTGARRDILASLRRSGRRARRNLEQQQARRDQHLALFDQALDEESEESKEEENPSIIAPETQVEEQSTEMSGTNNPPTNPTNPPQTKNVTISGITVEVLTTPTPDQDVKAGPIIKKEERVKLDQDKLLKITAQMEEGLEKKYTEVSVEEEDLSVLENTYELTQQNKKVFAKLEDWDMADVFTLVLSINAQGTAETKDLMKDWPTIPRKDVQKSNMWYRTNVNHTTSPWIVKKLRSSHRFILNSCDHEMQDQITDILLGYKESEKGRPLTFKILMDLVQSNSERAIKHLISSVKSMDIKNFDGEDVTAAVAQMRGAYNRLKMVNIGTSNQNAVPVTFNEDVMDVLQTTSTEDFNVAFDYQKQRAMFKLSQTSAVNPTIEAISLC